MIEENTLCDYIDPNKQNSDDMNLNCINNKSLGYNRYCSSEFKFYDEVASSMEYLNVKRSIDSGFGIQNSYNTQKIKDINKSLGIEGFTGKIFYTDNGIGKSYIEPGKCPEGYTYCQNTNQCVQVCTNCKYQDEMKSFEFNESDKCFPNGVYDGVDKQGNIKCNCGVNNKYCSDSLLNSFHDSLMELEDYLLL